jgi:trk system potassium uptake protein TrkH
LNLRASLRFLGRLLLLLAGAQLLPLVCSLIYGERESAIAFVASAAITALFGLISVVIGRVEGQLYRREGILIVVFGWVLASLFGALPYYLTGTLSHPVDALFEAASGFTTTGATVLPNIEAVDRGILLWRSFTQWLGGMGIIVLFVALLPELGPGARFLYKLEVPGPTAEALQPRIHTTASILWKIYLLFTVTQTILLMLVGLGLYDALCHTFSTLSTGGFSPRADSIAAFQSPAVEIIVILFMLLAGANFSLFFRFAQRRGWNLFKDAEFRLYIAILVGATLFVTWDLLQFDPSYTWAPRALLDAAFQVVSITTTTGFATANFENWPHFSRSLLVGLMFVGGCAGSTAGSMKVMRMVIGLKSAFREVRLIFSPNTVIRVMIGGKAVPDSVTRSVAGFFILYLSSWGVGTVLLSLLETDLLTAGTAAAATLGNIGPGLGEVGPWDSFAFFTAWKKLVMVLLMWLGRLELYSIAALFTRAFWRH